MDAGPVRPAQGREMVGAVHPAGLRKTGGWGPRMAGAIGRHADTASRTPLTVGAGVDGNQRHVVWRAALAVSMRGDSRSRTGGGPAGKGRSHPPDEHGCESSNGRAIVRAIAGRRSTAADGDRPHDRTPVAMKGQAPLVRSGEDAEQVRKISSQKSQARWTLFRDKTPRRLRLQPTHTREPSTRPTKPPRDWHTPFLGVP